MALQGAKALFDMRMVSWIFCEFDPFLLRRAGTSSSVLLDLLYDNGFACVNSRAKSWRPWNYYQIGNGSTTKHFWTNLLCGHQTAARWVGDEDWRRRFLGDTHTA